MLASLKHKIVFCHIPKTAGTSIRNTLAKFLSDDPKLIKYWGIEDGLDLAHPTAEVIRTRYPEIWRLFFGDVVSFAIVRNPITRAKSAYSEHLRQYRDHPRVAKTFEDYLAHIADNVYRFDQKEGYIFIHGAPQHEFISFNYCVLPRVILRFEDGDLSQKVSEILKYVVFVPHLHKSSMRVWQSWKPVSRKQRILIEKTYQRDFEMFGY